MKRLLYIGSLILLVLLPAGVTQSQDEKVAEDGDFVYDDHGKRDPFWTLIGRRGTIVNYDKDIQASDMVLEGVMIEPGGASIAIINGTIVQTGDKVGLFIVTGIGQNEVVLEKGQERITLTIKKEE